MTSQREQPHNHAQCEAVQGKIQDWILDKNHLPKESLAEPLPEPLDEHVTQCGPCQGFYGQLLALESGLQNLPRNEAPNGFSERVMARLDAMESTSTLPHTEGPRGILLRFRQWGLPLTAAAAIALVIFASNGIHQPVEMDTQDAPRLIAAAPPQKTMKSKPSQSGTPSKVLTASTHKTSTSSHINSRWEPGEDIMANGSPYENLSGQEPWEMEDPLADLVGF